MPNAAPPSEPDLGLIGPTIATPGGDDEALYKSELETYNSIDEESDRAYERRISYAFHVRELKQIDDIVDSRRTYANKIFLLVVCWLAAMGLLLLLAGFHFCGFQLDTKILLAMIGGTTLNVLGIFTIVANFLFPKNGHSILSQAKSEKIKPRKQPQKSRGQRGGRSSTSAEGDQPIEDVE